METTKTTSLTGLSAKLNDLLIKQAAEQVRIEKIAPKTGYIMAEGITPAQKAEVVSINAMPATTPELISAKKKKVNGLKALGWIVKQSGKLDDKELATIKAINADIKTVVDQIRDLGKSSVTRAGQSHTGELSQPAGFYKVTDQIKKDMHVRDIAKVGKDIVATYDTKDKVGCRSKIVNAAIQWQNGNRPGAKA